MEGKIDENMVLDYAVFHLSPSKNSYEAVACSKDKTEMLAVGPLDQLALHLREASSLSGNSFKLQLTENLKSSSWFTKSTLTRFLHIVNTPEVLKAANAIESEMSQLEETKRFHLTLYAKGHPHHAGDGTTDFLKEVGLTQKVKVETALSDATKNELIRAMDLRLTALGEKLTAAFNEAAGGTCSAKQISDLVAFAQHIGEVDLRNCLLKYLSLISKDELDHSDDHPTFPPNRSNSTGNETEAINQTVQQVDIVKPVINQTVQQVDIVKPVINGISPAKIAQAERQSSSESEESESNDEGPSSADRSRSLMRSSSARRSASPMRRIQIGKSGSRRSTALTIRSLSYFPARERAFNRDTDETNSGDEDSDQPPKKPENNTVRRMSVQDAISLFESKQKEQKSDVQAKNPSADVSVSNKKSVLRRWSSGMSVEATAGTENASKNLPLDSDDNKSIEVKTGSDSLADSINPVEGPEAIVSSDVKMITPSSTDGSTKSVIPKAEETNEQTTASAEWNRQKEAELNQMLMKMMESKPGKYRGTNVGKGERQDVSGEQRGGFYSQYKEKRDEKLRAENTRLRAVKEARFKVMQETLEQSKAEMASKAECIKQDSVSHSQRPRRNSAPPVLPKKETPKPISSRKASPRLPLPGTRGSSGPLPRTAATPPAKPSPRTAPSSSAPTRRKPQATPSPTKASPRSRTEVPPQQQKGGGKGLRIDSKPSMKSQVDKPLKPVTKTVKSVKNKSPTASEADSGTKSAKPSLYSKVTKKNSVVPVESKPFLRKGTGIGPGVGPVLAKTKVPQSDESSKNSGNLIQSHESDPAATMVESIIAPVEHVLQSKGDVDEILEIPSPVVTDFDHETSKNSDKSNESSLSFSVQRPIAEIQPDEEMSISSAAWVEVEHPEVSASCDNGLPEPTTSPGLAPMASTSPHIRHSLSQMLLADNSEPDIVEWGNAEIPPALVYQKDAPKGFKRLLKFGRKNKGDPSATGCSSPSVFSEGEDDLEDSKTASKRSSDTLLRRAALQATAYGPQKNVCSESFDADSKRNWGVHDSLSVADKLREGPTSATATSTKAARSFFSLSAFRSGKSSEAKHR